jgi:6-phosphogluconolactonase
MAKGKSTTRSWFGFGAAVCWCLALVGCSGGGMMATSTMPPAVVQSSSLAFVSNLTSNTISVFQVDPSSGKLSAIAGGPFATDNGPEFLAVTPGGKFLFVGNSGSDTVSGFQINGASGALTAIPGSPFVTGARPEGVAVDPMGRFLFVGNQAAGNISVFTIGSNGSLAPVAGSPFAASNPFQVAVHPSGTIMYATYFPVSQVSDVNTVSAFQFGANGALAAVPGSPFPADNSP